MMTNSMRIAIAGLAIPLAPAVAFGQLGPDDYLLHFMVRDMRPGHPDFTAVSPDAFIRIANLVSPAAVGRAPGFSGAGVELTTPAMDSGGNLIPHSVATVGVPSGAGAGPTGIASESPTILKDGAGVDAYAISLLSVTYNPDETSTWIYQVEELAGGHDLRGWSLDLDPGHVVMPGTTVGYARGVGGIGWDVPTGFSDGEFTIVLDQWYEADMWQDNVHTQSCQGVVLVESAPIFLNKAYADTYDSAAGPYDPETAGPAPAFVTGSTMPELTEPSLSVPWTPSYILTKKQVTTLGHDIHTDEFRLRNGHTLQIDGDVTILVEKAFELNNSSKLELMPGATLKLYFKGSASVEQASGLNQASQDPSRVQIFNLGSDPFVVRNHNMVFASLVSPDAPLVIENNTDFFGSVVAQSVHMRNSSGLHIDGLPTADGAILAPTTAVATPGAAPGCLDPHDTLAEFGLPHDGAITSQAWFQTWFNSSMQSRADSRSMVMAWSKETSSWRFKSADFRPIDGALYGAGTPAARNGTYTVLVDASFDFAECSELFFELAADGDAWVFIDGQLILDMGGVQDGDRQLLELDRLELDPKVGHRLLLCFAHRTDEAADFEIHTNLDLHTFTSRSGVAPLSD